MHGFFQPPKPAALDNQGSRFSHALAAYEGYIADRYANQTSLDPINLSIKLLREVVEDFPLSALTADKLDTLFALWASRPKSKTTGKTLAFSTCRNVLIHFRAFLRWLSRSEAFKWTLPAGYIIPRCRIRKDTAAPRRRFSTRRELLTVWKYAKPWDRAVLILALNFGFAQAEISTLRGEEIEKRGARSYVNRHRRKTGVRAEWVIWPETAEALDYLRQSKPADSPFLVHNTNGKNLLNKKNENQIIANHWNQIPERSQNSAGVRGVDGT